MTEIKRYDVDILKANQEFLGMLESPQRRMGPLGGCGAFAFRITHLSSEGLGCWYPKQ